MLLIENPFALPHLQVYILTKPMGAEPESIDGGIGAEDIWINPGERRFGLDCQPGSIPLMVF